MASAGASCDRNRARFYRRSRASPTSPREGCHLRVCVRSGLSFGLARELLPSIATPTGPATTPTRPSVAPGSSSHVPRQQSVVSRRPGYARVWEECRYILPVPTSIRAGFTLDAVPALVAHIDITYAQLLDVVALREYDWPRRVPASWALAVVCCETGSNRYLIRPPLPCRQRLHRPGGLVLRI